MDKYDVLIADSVADFINRLDKGEKARIIKRLDMLSLQPYSAGEPRVDSGYSRQAEPAIESPFVYWRTKR